MPQIHTHTYTHTVVSTHTEKDWANNKRAKPNNVFLVDKEVKGVKGNM